MLAQAQFGYWDIAAVVAYMVVTAYLGYLGWRRTRSEADYLIGGRKTHPFIMALSYGSTFISTSAIVGFGGVAAQYGLSILWLVFLNIFVGIFIAFVGLGAPTRRMGHALDAHTFPELLGKRFASKFVQVFSGLIIFFLMPLYAGAVLMGGCEFIEKAFGIPYNVAVFVFTVIVAGYVIYGGLKGVMYTDALQGAIMIVGMVILLIYCYTQVGGVVSGHRQLAAMNDLVPPNLKAIGHQGWTHFPLFGFGDAKYNLWWIMVSTIILGVGIGVLAQPQLVVRFMTVKSRKELNRAVILGGLFILLIPGTAYVTGALSNVYFHEHAQPVTGKMVKPMNAEKGEYLANLAQKDAQGQLVEVMVKGKPIAVPIEMEAGSGPVKAGDFITGRSIAIAYAGGNGDQIIPAFITSAMPKWFGLLFLLTLLAAAMSTLSGQFHALGTAISRDVYEQFRHVSPQTGAARSFLIVRLGILVGIIMATAVAYYLRGDFIARATAIFFGICACTFLPAYVGGLFFRWVTKAGAIASMIVGSGVHIFWVVFIKQTEAGTVGIVQHFLPKGTPPSLLWDKPNWPMVDPIVIGLPLSILTMVVVSLLTRRPAKEHLDKCFPPKG